MAFNLDQDSDGHLLLMLADMGFEPLDQTITARKAWHNV